MTSIRTGQSIRGVFALNWHHANRRHANSDTSRKDAAFFLELFLELEQTLKGEARTLKPSMGLETRLQTLRPKRPRRKPPKGEAPRTCVGP